MAVSSAVAVSSLALLLPLLLCACGPAAVHFPTPQSPITAMHHDDYEALLGRYRNQQGDVDYQRWQDSAADVAQLDGYLGRMAAAPPDLQPNLYTSAHDELSYWINLYNALVVREVVRRWPLASVRDYQPTLGSKIDTTKGFFRDLRFSIGSKELSLDDIENQTIRKQFADARIHFALNCGSASCPVLGASAYTGKGLEAELQSATVNFINSRENLRIDKDKRRIHLSKIFKWYSKDFAKHAQNATGKSGAGSLDFVALFTKPELSASLEEARAGKFKVVYSDYSWAVNQGESKARAALSSGPAGTTGAEIAKGESRSGSAKPARDSSLAAGARRIDYPEAPLLPPLTMSLLSGIQASRREGVPLLISFWATYCVPCRQSLPHLQAIAERHAGSLQVLALSADDSRAKVEDFLRQQGLALDVAMGDEVATLMSQLKVRGLPTEIFVDKAGHLRFSLVGAASNRQLDEAVAEILAQ